MKIIHLTAEFAPIAKVGGMGEVLVGLCRELTKLGESVEVILPKYDFINASKLSNLKLEIADFKCLEKGNLHPNSMWSATSEECQLRLLEARHPSGYFHRGKIYGCEDDIPRFLYFSRACLEYLKIIEQPIDILHVHDWHVAIAAVLARDVFRIPIRAIVLTIHNGEYQGHCATWDLNAIGLDGINYLCPEKLLDNDPKRPKTINLLKGGIVYADAVNAVSPTYAKELLTSEMGFHLDPTFRKYKEKLSGILNGIDSKLWDPGNDSSLSSFYNSESSLQSIKESKKNARKLIQDRFGIASDKRPWIGAITRLAAQKGPDLLIEALKQTLELGGSFLLLGSSPDPKIQEKFNHLKQQYADNPQVLLHFEYDETLAHQLYAALDFLIVPSLFEPCGLTQLIAMRYGTVPIVRSTGGLKDTVFDADDATIPAKQRNGFTFRRASSHDLSETMRRAVHLFRTDEGSFQSLIRRDMLLDFSWKKPAQQYLQVYRSILQKKEGASGRFQSLSNVNSI